MFFKEYMIKKKRTAGQTLLSVLLYIAATILAAVSIILLIKVSSIGALVAFAWFFAAYRISTGMKKEFEYTFANDNITIDVIMNASRRKRIISFSLSEVSVIASADDERYSAQFSKKYDKTIDATSGSKNANVYCALINAEIQTLVKFEPPYNALTELQKLAPSKIIIKD